MPGPHQGHRLSTCRAAVAVVMAATLLIGLLAVPAGAQTGDESVSDPEERQPLVYGGSDAENPGFVAYLEIGLGSIGTASCTGSLIDPSWVLTAAHCVDGPVSGIRLTIGDADRRFGVVRQAAAWYPHPSYDPNKGFGRSSSVDIALVRLSSPVDGLPLARLNTDTDYPELYQPFVIAGWGQVDPFGDSPFQLQAGVTDATSAVDGSFYSPTCVRPSGYTDYFCFGGLSAVNACPGDSGGPLFSWADPVAATGPVDTIYGLVSYGDLYACSAFSDDSVATAVAPQVPWVESVSGLAFGNRFVDVGDDNLFRADIEWLAAKDITRGCNPPANTYFCPTDLVTREQFAAFVVRALDLTANDGRTFSDVPAGSTFESDIQKLATAGITRGCGPTTFCPKDPVSRQQMAAFITRMVGLTANDGTDFVDVDDDNIFRADIQKLATADIARGCNPPANTAFCPGDLVTRQQMAAFLRRALEDLLGP